MSHMYNRQVAALHASYVFPPVHYPARRARTCVWMLWFPGAAEDACCACRGGGFFY